MIECIECSDFAERFVAYQCLHINRGCRLPHYTAIVKHIKTEKYIDDTDVVVTKAGIVTLTKHWMIQLNYVVLVAPTRVVCWFNSSVVGSSNSYFHKLVTS
jgi:hypothetical protein